MSPGASEKYVWPIEQQKELFSLFEYVEKLIGVKLTDSYLMIPNKSVSGFLSSSKKIIKVVKFVEEKIVLEELLNWMKIYGRNIKKEGTKNE